MITLKRVLEEYDWQLTVVLGVTHEEEDIIYGMLVQIGCTEENSDEACKHICDGDDRGLTYSNIKERITLVITSQNSNRGEFVNTITHEMFHVVSHICEAYGIDMKSERPCYLMGNLCQWITENNGD